jgi:fumarate hydratase class II
MPDRNKLYGAETAKAIENFPISGERVPVAVVHWLARLKGAAAAVNHELGLLDGRRARAIERAAKEVAQGRHDEQFPIDVFQTGSGTSTNMNVNEVLATLAGEGVHPNDHVNMGQSSNDVFPSAVHLAALGVAREELLPALRTLERSLARKARSFRGVVKAGRTHLMDAVPVTLGQELSGYAAQVALGAERVHAALGRVGEIPLGGTATGTGLNTHPQFAAKVRQALAREYGMRGLAAPRDRFEAQANRDALVELSGALKVVAVSLTKIANDIALMGSGPRTGIGELVLPELQKGSSIMPGKVNPVIPEVVLQVAAQVIGNDAAITIGGMQGQFELNVRVPLIARNLLASLHLLASASRALAEKCVDGIEANRAVCEANAAGTLAIATALNRAIGYDKGAAIVKRATESGRPLREVALEQGVDAELYDATIDLHRIAMGNQADGAAPAGGAARRSARGQGVRRPGARAAGARAARSRRGRSAS